MSARDCYSVAMRPSICIAATLLATASPAFATGTILCRSTISPTDGPQLSLVVGHGAASGVAQARLSYGDQNFTTGQGADAPVIAQAWVDRDMLKLDIVDANAEAVIASLDTRRRRGSDYLGMLRYRGRTWRVRCDEQG